MKTLSRLLREAKDAHGNAEYAGKFEHLSGHDWAEWYAEWLLPKIETEMLHEVVEATSEFRNLNDAKGGMKL